MIYPVDFTVNEMTHSCSSADMWEFGRREI
jgi:hypothetical protein